ncbi:MAG: PEP-CTERM sorting domain-containing protein, partial [Verrucomicrobiota bacterium]
TVPARWSRENLPVRTPVFGLARYDAAGQLDSAFGSGGKLTLSFAQPITNGPGADFAVFENGITDEFLELAFVEVSSDGVNFVRFPSVSLTPANVQIGTFGSLDPTNLHNLAGKYRTGFGTPFDLAELAGNPLLNLGSILQVRVIDVVGSVARNSQTLEYWYGRFDSRGNVINDPWTTPFETSGFDLDAIGVFHQVPEPGTALLLGLGAVLLGSRRRAARKTG